MLFDFDEFVNQFCIHKNTIFLCILMLETFFLWKAYLKRTTLTWNCENTYLPFSQIIRISCFFKIPARKILFSAEFRYISTKFSSPKTLLQNFTYSALTPIFLCIILETTRIPKNYRKILKIFGLRKVSSKYILFLHPS